METIEGPLPAVRTVARCALLLGLLTAACAAYAVHSPPRFLQCPREDLDVAALPRRLLVCGAVQAAAAALALLLPAGGRAGRGLAFLALAALGVLTILLSVFTCYCLGLAGYGDKLLMALLVGEGSAVGVFAAVFRGGQEE